MSADSGAAGGFRYGIEHECALLRTGPGGERFADFTDLTFDELRLVVEELPAEPADEAGLRVGDAGIKAKRWYVEGYERFDEAGTLVRYDPKGMEVRTRIHGSVDGVVAALRADQELMDAALARRGLRSVVVGFNPLRSAYAIDPPLNAWERAEHATWPDGHTEHLHMVTYGPDLNLSAVDDDLDLVDVGRKLTYYSPWLVPLTFSSPFRDGGPWGGLSARTAMRTGPRPAARVFPADPALQLESAPALTAPPRIPAEAGRIEFKAFDPHPDPEVYGELLSLLTGLVLDDTLGGRATVPDAAAHRHVAVAGLDDDATHARTGELIDVAERVLDGAHRDRVARLRERWARRDCPAKDMLRRHAAGEWLVGLTRTVY